MYRNEIILALCCIVIVVSVVVKYDKLRTVAQTVDNNIAQVFGVIEPLPHAVIRDDAGNPIEIFTSTKPAVEVQKKPYITAESYLVGNIETGEIYLSQNTQKIFPIASVSKLYTALVIEHFFNPQSQIIINQTMLDGYGDAGGLVLGEIFTSRELLPALLLESSNDAAEAFAQSFGYDSFLSNMNGFAGEIGMSGTSFADASGISPGNVSNASDLFVLARYLYKHERDILDISQTPVYNLPQTDLHQAHLFRNINPYSERLSFIGGKTGRTNEARESMLSLFNQEVNGILYPLAVIVLRSDMGEREANTQKLLDLFTDTINK